MKRSTLGTALCVTFTGVAFMHAQQLREPSTQDERRAVEQAKARGGIPASAKVYGKYVSAELGSPDFLSGNV